MLKHAVDAVADAVALLVGLDVDVARALADRVDQDQVAELDDRRLLGFVLTVGQREVVVERILDLDLVELEIAEHLLVRRELLGLLGGVVALDRGLDRGVGADDRLDVQARHELDVVDRVDVRRVGHRDDQAVARLLHRDQHVLLCDLAWDESDDRGVDLEVVERDRWHSVLFGEKVRQLGLLKDAELGEAVGQALAG